MTTTTISTRNLPKGFIEVFPDLVSKDEHDEAFIKRLTNGLTTEEKSLKESGANWRWVLAGKMTRVEALEKLSKLGEGWRLPTPNDTSVGALNGIKFEGSNLVDNTQHRGDNLRTGTPYASFRTRAQIMTMFGFGMTCRVGHDSSNLVYFVMK